MASSAGLLPKRRDINDRPSMSYGPGTPADSPMGSGDWRVSVPIFHVDDPRAAFPTFLEAAPVHPNDEFLKSLGESIAFCWYIGQDDLSVTNIFMEEGKCRVFDFDCAFFPIQDSTSFAKTRDRSGRADLSACMSIDAMMDAAVRNLIDSATIVGEADKVAFLKNPRNQTIIKQGIMQKLMAMRSIDHKATLRHIEGAVDQVLSSPTAPVSDQTIAVDLAEQYVTFLADRASRVHTLLRSPAAAPAAATAAAASSPLPPPPPPQANFMLGEKTIAEFIGSVIGSESTPAIMKHHSGEPTVVVSFRDKDDARNFINTFQLKNASGGAKNIHFDGKSHQVWLRPDEFKMLQDVAAPLITKTPPTILPHRSEEHKRMAAMIGKIMGKEVDVVHLKNTKTGHERVVVSFKEGKDASDFAQRMLNMGFSAETEPGKMKGVSMYTDSATGETSYQVSFSPAKFAEFVSTAPKPESSADYKARVEGIRATAELRRPSDSPPPLIPGIRR